MSKSNCKILLSEDSRVRSGWSHVSKETGEGLFEAYVRGHAFYGDKLLRGKIFAEWLIGQAWSNNTIHETELSQITKLNGDFAFIVASPSRVVIVSDLIRSIPVYYSIIDGTLYVSDNSLELAGLQGNAKVSESSAIEFLLTSLVSGPDTLIERIKQTQSGEIVSVILGNNPVVETGIHSNFVYHDQLEIPRNEYFQLLSEVYDNLFDRFIRVLDGRRAVVPLSAGYDSRFIIAALKDKGYDNILTFTYGPPDEWEIAISKMIAGKLDLEWHCVDYTPDLCAILLNTDEFREYMHYGGGTATYAHMQDWIAVRQLRENNILRDDDVFAPGHGSWVAGGHVPSAYRDRTTVRLDDILSNIISTFYSQWRFYPGYTDMIPEITERIQAVTPGIALDSSDSIVNLFEIWDIRERQSKFIANSIRVYEFLGYDWVLPLWDTEAFHFWRRVPLRFRSGKQLFKDFLDDGLFARYSIPKHRDGGYEQSLSGRLRGYFVHLSPHVRSATKLVLKKLGLLNKIASGGINPREMVFNHKYADGRILSECDVGEIVKSMNGIGICPESIQSILRSSAGISLPNMHFDALHSAEYLLRLYREYGD